MESIISQPTSWIDLNNEMIIQDILKLSFIDKVLIFKHSTRCSISFMAKNRIESEFNKPKISKCYLLDLLKNSKLSNSIATNFNVFHESPQVLIIKDGKTIFNASHGNINWKDIP